MTHEIRFDEEGRLDEVIAHSPSIFHMELMDVDAWWIGIDLDDGERLTVSLWVEWRWTPLDCVGWRRWVRYPRPHIVGRAEVGG